MRADKSRQDCPEAKRISSSQRAYPPVLGSHLYGNKETCPHFEMTAQNPRFDFFFALSSFQSIYTPRPLSCSPNSLLIFPLVFVPPLLIFFLFLLLHLSLLFLPIFFFSYLFTYYYFFFLPYLCFFLFLLPFQFIFSIHSLPIIFAFF